MSAVFEWRDAIRRPPEGHALKATDRLVALVMSFYMDKDTLEGARPGPARLAAETGLGVSTVKLSLKSLVKAGWLAQTKQGGTRKGGTEKIASTYRGTWPTGERTRPGRAPVQDIDGCTRAGADRGPVQQVTGTRADAGHHLALDLEQDLVCVADLALSKLSVPTSLDTHAQEEELEGKVAALIATFDEDLVREALEKIPTASVPFAGELIRMIRAHLPDTATPTCGKCHGTGQIHGTGGVFLCGCLGPDRWVA